MGPSYAGTQTLKVEPASIPGALAAFRDAHLRVMEKVQALEAMQIPRWAGDPVSGETAEQFTERSNGGAADSAIACLRGYEKQLSNAIDALQKAYDAYVQVEGENTARWGLQDNGK
ncbi:transcriptional regulator [Actinokineospora sp. HUAS TT18]|uniref:transcriptional regulator n=1 Tax=Actinokineospora sp. HUAS TT18 TaxID=3447451 RepID=UPI003F522D2C